MFRYLTRTFRQVVSDWVAFILSIFCCQCWQPIGMSTSNSSTSHEFTPKKPFIDPDRACGEPLRAQRTTIDFTPQPEDSDEITTKCIQFWDFVKSQRELEALIVTAEPSPYPKEGENVPVHKKTSPSNDGGKKNVPPSPGDRRKKNVPVTHPAMKALSQIQKKGVLQPVLR